MRQRLDLEALLRKYQNNQLPRETTRDPGYLSPRITIPRPTQVRLKTQSAYYPQNDLRYFTVKNNLVQDGPRMGSLSFQMSKAECQRLLLSVKEELSNQQQIIETFISQSLKNLMDKFQRQHEQLRRELIGLLDHSLEQNKRLALEMIENCRKQFPRQYVIVGKNISIAHEEINQLLHSLNSNSFKRTIAEIVTKDFNQILKKIREQVMIANNNYNDGLSGIEIDRSKIIKIQQSLQKIYSWRTKQETFKKQERQDMIRSSRRSGKKNIFEPRANKMASTERSQYSAPKHMRRTFFNFQSN